MRLFETRSLDLRKVPGNDFIRFLRIEIPERRGYGPVRFARVRYALNGDAHEAENGMPIDLGKGIFTATLEDDELGTIPRDTLEKTLQKAAAEILKIVHEKLDPPTILESILKAYPYLEYDEAGSKPPDVLKGVVRDLKTPRHSADIFEIARRLNRATHANYQALYGGRPSDPDNFDETWTRFSLRKI